MNSNILLVSLSPVSALFDTGVFSRGNMRSAEGEIDCSDVVLFIIVTKDKLNRSDALLSGYLEILNPLDRAVQRKPPEKNIRVLSFISNMSDHTI